MKWPIFVVVTLVWSWSEGKASELRGYVGVGFRPVLEAVRPMFEKETGVELKVSYPATEIISEALEKGEDFDFILTSPLTLGVISKSSRDPLETWNVAKNGVGVGAGGQEPRKDLGSWDLTGRCKQSPRSIDLFQMA